MKEDPSKEEQRLSRDPSLRYFTNRESLIAAFGNLVNAPAGADLPVLVFFGPGGVGKSKLLQKLADSLVSRSPTVPCARFNLRTIGSSNQAYKHALIHLTTELEREFRLSFPQFDLCLGVLQALQGGEEPTLARVRASLQETLDFVAGLSDAVTELPVAALTIKTITDAAKRLASKYPLVNKWLREAGGTQDVLRLMKLARLNPETLSGELIRLFVVDLGEHLPKREGAACRGVLFLDTYEWLWYDREGRTFAQSQLVDEWVRRLSMYCRSIGVLVVVGGREILGWENVDSRWNGALEEYNVAGLSKSDAQSVLAMCEIGDAHPDLISDLQEAIINCSNSERDNAKTVRCHPLYLLLCAEVVLGARRTGYADPQPNIFNGIPRDDVAVELANLFLRSLHDPKMEAWIRELSLTPRFDQEAAIALDVGRNHSVGRTGWDILIQFSFLEKQPDGFYRLHKIMREALQRTAKKNDSSTLHRWFHDYWLSREILPLAWYHNWMVAPDKTLGQWVSDHESALKNADAEKARNLIGLWVETTLDDLDRAVTGEQPWARAHSALALALWQTPSKTRLSVLIAALQHSIAALQVYTEDRNPIEWARVQGNLGVIYSGLPTAGRGENLKLAIDYYMAASRVFQARGLLEEWAATQNNLGEAYRKLPEGDRAVNLSKALECFEGALRLRKEGTEDWAGTQNNLGIVYSNLFTGDRAGNLRRAILCYKAALRIYTDQSNRHKQAIVQSNLGVAYCKLPANEHPENFRSAIKDFEAALHIFTEVDFPVEWAGTQNNLGAAYHELDDIKRAIECYKFALRVRTREDFPVEWASTLLNLGKAYCDLKGDEHLANLQRAIECFSESASILSEDKFRLEWAAIQGNVADAYSQLSAKNHPDMHDKAVEACKGALRVFSEDEQPMDWAKIQYNFGGILVAHGGRLQNVNEIIEARACFEAARRGFKKVGMDTEAKEAENKVKLIDQALAGNKQCPSKFDPASPLDLPDDDKPHGFLLP